MLQDARLSNILSIPILLLTLLVACRPVFAQQFGKNGVQYTNFDWHYIQSEHFDIYYYPGGIKAAAFVAEVAESARQNISESWDYRLRGRIVVVLYNSHNDFEQTNLNVGPPEESVGGFTEFYKNRVVIPFEGSYEQLRHVTHHELTHAILLQMLFGTGSFSIVSGISRANIPLWFIEGLAEYESRGGWDKESDMFIRDAVVNGYLPPIRYLYGFLAYKGGQSVLSFIADEYGKEKISEILGKVRVYKDIEKALELSIGCGLDELTHDWHKYLKKKYWNEYPERAEAGDFARQLTFHNRDHNFINNSGALSPQADKVAYLSDKSGYFDIYLVSAISGMPLKKIVSGQKSGSFEEMHWLRPGITWNPEGTQIAFAAKDREQDALHIVDVASKEVKSSLKFALDGIFSPDWSPDGSQIAFVGSKEGESNLYLVSTKSRMVQKLTADLFSDLEPRWSPDGTEIVFISDRGSHVNRETLPEDFKMHNSDYHQFDVYTINIKSQHMRRITDTSSNEKSPIWIPDGSGIAFVSDRNGISNIYLKRRAHAHTPAQLVVASTGSRNSLDSTERAGERAWQESAYPITNVLSGIDHLSWQGERLVFTSFNNGGFDVFLMTKPLSVNPEQIHLMPTEHVIDLADRLTAIDSESSEKAPSPADSLKSRPLQNFVFGKKFRNGRPVSAFAASAEMFLPPNAYLNDSGFFKTKRYRTKFSADIVTAGAGFDPFFGFQGATLVSFSDLMGNHRFNFVTDVFVDFKNSDFAFGYQYRPRQTDYGAGFYLKNYLFFSRGRFLVRDRNLGLRLQMNRPFDRYRRLSYGVDFRFIYREGLADLLEDREELADGSTKVALVSLAYIKDNVIWGFTGPRAGSRLNLSVKASPDLGSNGLDFRIYQFDYRTYINFSKRHTYAIRFHAGFSEGRNKQRFFLGGMPNWINLKFRKDVSLELEDVYFSNFASPLRGYDYYEQIGAKFFLGNFELRIPFVDYVQTSWPLRLRFANIRSIFFLDFGSAWDDNLNLFSRTSGGGIKFDDLLMSFGWGARVNMGFVLLKYDIAWRTDLTGVTSPRNLVSIGADF